MIEQDIARKMHGETVRLFQVPQLTLLALERYQQDNLKVLFCLIFKKIIQENKPSPKSRIEALSTGLSNEKKQEIFEAYYDALSYDYINVPVCIKGKYYDLLTWVNMLVQNTGIEVNLSGTQESAEQLKKEMWSKASRKHRGFLCYLCGDFRATSGLGTVRYSNRQH